MRIALILPLVFALLSFVEEVSSSPDPKKGKGRSLALDRNTDLASLLSIALTEAKPNLLATALTEADSELLATALTSGLPGGLSSLLLLNGSPGIGNGPIGGKGGKGGKDGIKGGKDGKDGKGKDFTGGRRR